MATFMIFGLAGLCAYYIGKIVLTGMAPARFGPDIDLRNRPVSRYISIVLYGLLVVFGICSGMQILNMP